LAQMVADGGSPASAPPWSLFAHQVRFGGGGGQPYRSVESASTSRGAVWRLFWSRSCPPSRWMIDDIDLSNRSFDVGRLRMFFSLGGNGRTTSRTRLETVTTDDRGPVEEEQPT
jgi:hypothetical protein